jgi:translocator protein
VGREKSFSKLPVLSKKDILRIVISVGVPLLAGSIASIFTSESISTWYRTLEKPSLTPPDWIFGPVWTTLYIVMGVSLFLVWRATTRFPDTKRRIKIVAFVAFGTQLALNVLWSLLFFGLRSPPLAFAEILVLFASIVVTIAIFYKISRLAALLLIPYAGWTAFASLLNLQIWLLN